MTKRAKAFWVVLAVLMLSLVFSDAFGKRKKNRGKGNTQESASDMIVMHRSNTVPMCDNTMSTNHFTLADGEASIPIVLDYSGCPPSAVDRLLFFGYATTNVSSRQFVESSQIRMTVTNNDTGTTAHSGGNVPNSGAGTVMISPTFAFNDALIAEAIPASATMFVTNESGGVVKVRLRAFAYFISP